MTIKPTGEELKAAGIAKRLENERQEWLNAALMWLGGYIRRRDRLWESDEFTLDDFRMWWDQFGYIAPNHSNSWGALTNAAAKAGIIKATGRYVRSTRPSAHRRPIMVWTRGDRI